MSDYDSYNEFEDEEEFDGSPNEEMFAPVATALQYTIVGAEDGSKNITVFQTGEKPLVAHSSHPSFDQIFEGVLANDQSVLDLFDLALTAGQKFQKLTTRISASNGRIFLDGERMDNALTKQVLRFLSDGVDDWKPLVNFCENLQSNPDENSREDLYRFIEANEISLTEDGMLVGYKGLDESGDGYQSRNSGTAIVDGEVYEDSHIPQGPGCVVEMPRSEVTNDPGTLCHIGLHVGSYRYASGFAPKTFEVHVNPRDVVSVPSVGDKLRCCRYTVVQLLNEEITEPVVESSTTVFEKAVKLLKGDRDLRVGDKFTDRDKRRQGRKLTVLSTAAVDGKIRLKTETGDEVLIKLDRLFSRHYKRTSRGKKS